MDVTNKYLKPYNRYESQIKLFQSFTQQVSKRDNKVKNKKTEKKGKSSSGVLVTTATSKEKVRKLKMALMEKITEVLSGEDDKNLKAVKVHNLQQKINSLNRILSAIEQKEREKVQRQKEDTQKKKHKRESVYLTKDDLTVNSKNRNCDTGGTAAGTDIQSSINASTDIKLNNADASVNDNITIDIML